MSSSSLTFLTRSQIPSLLPPSTPFAPNPDPSNKDISKSYQSARLPSTLPALVFLGIDDRVEGGKKAEDDPKDPKGVPYFVLEYREGEGELDAEKLGGEWVEPRAAGSLMNGWEANIFAQARALIGKSRVSPSLSFSCPQHRRLCLTRVYRHADWNTRYRFCPGCGSPTYSLWCGWKRGCGSVVGEGKGGFGGDGGKVCPST
jgi:NAD+ diphosphatase